MKKIGGYIVMILGLIVLVFAPRLSQGILASLPKAIIYVIGILLMIVGFFLTLSKKQIKGLKNELPIYEGEKIVGYRRHKK